ncbi:M42 family peptidase [Candidatus Woesearchaeota archaeon]|nr:MAG: M42 family peptidase [Candidatus Woesearchaeota archaeon]
MTKLLEELCNAFGPSGDEAEVRTLLKKEMKKHLKDVRVDKFGNLICRKEGKGPRIMLAAHMDEIGLMIKDIKEDGSIRFSTIGGIEPITLVGQEVIIKTKKGKKINGVISFEELQNDYAIEELPSVDELYIDIGLDKKAVKKLGIEVGDYALPKTKFKTLGSKDIISGKALDDRIGCYILVEIAKRLKKSSADIFFVFTVQEEIGLYGAHTSVHAVDPDYGIAVETTNAEDAGEEDVVQIGKGPVLILKDSEIITNECLDDDLRLVARKLKKPLQLKVEELGTTDATKIMLSKGGVPSTTLSVAVRNIHSTISVSSLKDVQDVLAILLEFLKKPPRTCIK